MQAEEDGGLQLPGLPSGYPVPYLHDKTRQVGCIPFYIRVSPAERAVLVELTRDGAANKVIANRLGVTDDTIKCHIKNVLSRIPHINDRTALSVALLRGAVRTERKDSKRPGSGSLRRLGESPGQAHRLAASDASLAP